MRIDGSSGTGTAAAGAGCGFAAGAAGETNANASVSGSSNDMPFRFSLFRAPDGLGPMSTWEREHRQPLGRRDDVKAALDAVLPGLRWEESSGMLFGSGAFDGEEHAYEISLFGGPGETLLDVDVYARPPAIRAIMSGLGLNHCHAAESGDVLFPFEVADHWPGVGR